MRDEFKRYLDKKFANYKKSKALNEFKEEILGDLTERYEDFRAQGFSEEESKQKSLASLGDYTEALKTIDAHTPEKTAAAYSKLVVSLSFLYYTVLIIVFFTVSFLTRAWKYTWIILAVGVAAHAVFMFILNSKNAFVNKRNGKVRLYSFMLCAVFVLVSYLVASFVTHAWSYTWLIILFGAAVSITLDILIAKVKNKKPMKLRLSASIMLWTVGVYLTVSVFVGSIWAYSWLIVLLGVALLLAYHSVHAYKKYGAEIKGRDGGGDK